MIMFLNMNKIISGGSSTFSRTKSRKGNRVSGMRKYFAYLIIIIGTETGQNKNVWKQA